MRDEQVALTEFEELEAVAVGHAAGQFDLHANELGPFGLVVLVEPVGHREPERVVVRFGE